MSDNMFNLRERFGNKEKDSDNEEQNNGIQSDAFGREGGQKTKQNPLSRGNDSSSYKDVDVENWISLKGHEVKYVRKDKPDHVVHGYVVSINMNMNTKEKSFTISPFKDKGAYKAWNIEFGKIDVLWKKVENMNVGGNKTEIETNEVDTNQTSSSALGTTKRQSAADFKKGVTVSINAINDAIRNLRNEMQDFVSMQKKINEQYSSMFKKLYSAVATSK
jgi:hypothetical protein